MHTTSILPTPTGVGAASLPSGAAALRSRLARAGLAIWRTLEASGHDRAMREMRHLQDRWEISDPEIARVVRDGTAFLQGRVNRTRD